MKLSIVKCHTFSEPQAQPDLNDDDDDNNDDDINNINANDIKEDYKEEEEDDEKLFFSKVSSVIPFWNHKLGVI